MVRLGADHFKRIIINVLPCETAKWSEFWQACIGGKNTDVPVYAILLIRVASLFSCSSTAPKTGFHFWGLIAGLAASEDKTRSPSGLCAGCYDARRDGCMWIAAPVVVISIPVLPSFLAADIHG